MLVTSLKDLEALIKLCHKLGVKTFSEGGLTFSLDSVPSKTKRNRKAQPNSILPVNAFSDPGPIQTDEPTDEELMFWSVNSSEYQQESQ